MDRRRLLRNISAGLLSTKLRGISTVYGEQPVRIAANDRINVGVIGPGSRGLEVTRQLLRVPGVEITAVCDVYEPRFAQVNQLVGKKVPAHKDYRELLDRKDLDAILIASPPVFHAEHTIASLESGRPVYGEKTLGFTPEDCHHVVESVIKNKQIYQIGHQYRYASWFQKSINRIHRGDIGEPTHVYGYWHRSDNWRRPVPDPSLEHLLNWRLYKETSGGLFEELGSHHIDIANWVFGEHPQTVLGTSSIVVYNDGRTVGDNVHAVLGYSKGRRLVFSSLTDNGMAGDSMWIYGTEGSVLLTLEDATFYREKTKPLTAASHTGVVERGVKTGSSYHTGFAMPYRGPGEPLAMGPEEDPTLTACREFIQSVRNKQQPLANVRVGFGSGIACSIGRTALAEGRVMEIPSIRNYSS